jgi:hypothetical protein
MKEHIKAPVPTGLNVVVNLATCEGIPTGLKCQCTIKDWRFPSTARKICQASRRTPEFNGTSGIRLGIGSSASSTKAACAERDTRQLTMRRAKTSITTATG